MAFERFGGPSGDSGRIYESRFLGKAEVDASFAEELEKLPRGERRRFRSDEDVFRLFKEHYKGDPTDPKGVHAKELRGALIDAMELGEGLGAAGFVLIAIGGLIFGASALGLLAREFDVRRV